MLYSAFSQHWALTGSCLFNLRRAKLENDFHSFTGQSVSIVNIKLWQGLFWHVNISHMYEGQRQTKPNWLGNLHLTASDYWFHVALECLGSSPAGRKEHSAAWTPNHFRKTNLHQGALASRGNLRLKKAKWALHGFWKQHQAVMTTLQRE